MPSDRLLTQPLRPDDFAPNLLLETASDLFVEGQPDSLCGYVAQLARVEFGGAFQECAHGSAGEEAAARDKNHDFGVKVYFDLARRGGDEEVLVEK